MRKEVVFMIMRLFLVVFEILKKEDYNIFKEDLS